jgi:demethylmenaquinone methyltransferase/2-methoxy-6-polyprenyl-1,4-benzoquinol methylase
MALTRAEIASAYTSAAAGWAEGPSRIYRRLAAELIDRSPVSLAGRHVLDVGAGTGAATEAIRAAGGRPVDTDASLGMLSLGRGKRPPSAQADAMALPFASRAVGAVVASFVFNHVDDAAMAVREAARVTERGGVVLASSYASDDTHPVKAAVETAMVESGWSPEAWYEDVRSVRVPSMATVAACQDVLRRARLDGSVELARVQFTDLEPLDLVKWRLGMAQYASHLAALTSDDHDRLRSRSLELLGANPPVLERVVLFVAVVV